MPLTAPTLRRLLRARDRLHAEYAGPLTIDDLAEAAGLSRWHFQRCFRDAFGATAHDYLSQLRLARAKDLLARGASVTETCLAVGYASLGTFSTWFSRAAGASPARWQRTTRRLVAVPELLPLLRIPCCFVARFTPSTLREVGAAGGVVEGRTHGGKHP